MAHRQFGTPLRGVRVLDLSRLLPGPFCSLLLADMGADVVKVEAPEGGDYARWYPPLVEGGGYGAFFGSINRGKRSLALDLKHPQGREAFLRLVAGADVVLESFRPGVLGRLGLDWEVLRGVNRGLVMCAISGHGQDGPYAQRAAHDMNVLAISGVLDQIGEARGRPVVPGIQAADVASALYAATAISAALVQRARTGEGAYLDVSMGEAALAFHIPVQAECAARGGDLGRGEDLLSGGVPCYGVYETGDGRYLSVGALEPMFWGRFLGVIGLTEFASQGLSTGEDGEAVRRAVAKRIAEEPLAVWQARFAGVDACVEPVLTPSEVRAHPQFAARGVFFEVGGLPQVATPLLDLEGRGGVLAPPGLGAHGPEVLTEAGFSAEEIAGLVACGAVALG